MTLICKLPVCLIKSNLILSDCREQSIWSGAMTSFSFLLRKASTLNKVPLLYDVQMG